MRFNPVFVKEVGKIPVMLQQLPSTGAEASSFVFKAPSEVSCAALKQVIRNPTPANKSRLLAGLNRLSEE